MSYAMGSTEVLRPPSPYSPHSARSTSMSPAGRYNPRYCESRAVGAHCRFQAPDSAIGHGKSFYFPPQSASCLL